MSRALNSSGFGIDRADRQISQEELEATEIVQLPEREALSVAFPLAGPLSLGGVAKSADAVAETIEGAAADPVV